MKEFVAIFGLTVVIYGLTTTNHQAPLAIISHGLIAFWLVQSLRLLKEEGIL